MKHIKHIFRILISLSCLCSMSCEYFSIKKAPNETILARVHDVYLTSSEIKKVLPEQYSKEDSILFVSNYINLWARNQLLLRAARLNMDVGANNFEDLVEKYRQDLWINSYKEALIGKLFDETISEKEMIDFYNNNKESFILGEDILQFLMVQCSKDIINRDEVINLVKKGDMESITLLKSKKLAFKSYHFEDSLWVKKSAILKKLYFLKNEEAEKIVKKNSFQIVQDSLDIYIFKIENVLTKNTAAPFVFATNKIKQMVLHKRKKEIIRDIEKNIVEDAINEKQFEKY